MATVTLWPKSSMGCTKSFVPVLGKFKLVLAEGGPVDLGVAVAQELLETLLLNYS